MARDTINISTIYRPDISEWCVVFANSKGVLRIVTIFEVVPSLADAQELVNDRVREAAKYANWSLCENRIIIEKGE